VNSHSLHLSYHYHKDQEDLRFHKFIYLAPILKMIFSNGLHSQSRHIISTHWFCHCSNIAVLRIPTSQYSTLNLCLYTVPHSVGKGQKILRPIFYSGRMIRTLRSSLPFLKLIILSLAIFFITSISSYRFCLRIDCFVLTFL